MLNPNPMATREELFRKQALERALMSDNLERLMPVAGGKEWLMIAALGALLALVVLWSILGRVPTIAAGRGVIVRPRQMVDTQSAAAGRLLTLRVHAGDHVRVGDLIATIDESEIRKRAEEDRRTLESLEEQSQRLSSAGAGQTALQGQQDGLERTGLEAQRENLRKSLAAANSLKPILEAHASANREMVKAGLMASTAHQISDAETAVRDNDAKIYDYSSRLSQIDGQLKLIDTRGAALDRDLLSASAARRSQIEQLRHNIAIDEFELRRNGNVLSQYSGRVAEVLASPGQVLPVGGRLLTLEAEEPESSLVSISYFPVRDGKKIQPGMPIQITPDTVERERYGGILGTVVSVSPSPVTKDGAKSVLGNPELVQALMPEGAYIEVRSRLEPDASTVSGYRWSSSRGPSVQITSGLTHSTRVTIERRAPVSYLFPALRDSTGIY
jgi:HlyD family secretion protein